MVVNNEKNTVKSKEKNKCQTNSRFNVDFVDKCLLRFLIQYDSLKHMMICLKWRICFVRGNNETG